MNRDEIDTAYGHLYDATSQHHVAKSAYETAKLNYDVAKSVMVHSGKVEGKNVQQRDAHLTQLLSEENSELNLRKAQLDAARAVLDLANIDVKWVSTRLHLMEIESSPEEKPEKELG